jgi:hypothetical protein
MSGKFSSSEKEKEKSIPKMNERIFSNPNIISSNYKQGIILVEGSSALIFGNKIDRNIKANIALGGRSSGLT